MFSQAGYVLKMHDSYCVCGPGHARKTVGQRDWLNFILKHLLCTVCSVELGDLLAKAFKLGFSINIKIYSDREKLQFRAHELSRTICEESINKGRQLQAW